MKPHAPTITTPPRGRAAAAPPAAGRPAAGLRKRRRVLLREEEGRIRLVWARRYAAQLARGLTIRRAAEVVRLPVSTIFKWHQRWKRNGAGALITRTSPGRKIRFRFNLADLTPGIVRAVQRLVILRGGREKAWRAFARTSACPPRLAAALRASKHLPEALLDLVRLTVTEEPITIYRGLNGHVVARVRGRERLVRPYYCRAA